METPLFIDAAGSLMAAPPPASCTPDCHRAYISDWLVAYAQRVVHLIGANDSWDHPTRLSF